MLSIYVGKEIITVDESNLLDMDINVLKNIPYSIACKYNEYISALEVCVEDCLNIPADVHDEASYMEALVELETIMENDKEEEVMVENNIVTESIVIDGVVVDGVVVEVENNTNNKEENVMGTVKENMVGAVEEMMGKFAEAKENIKVNAGETKEEYFDKVDDSLNVMKGALGNVLGTLDGVLGYTVLKNSIIDIMEAGSDGKTSGKSLFKMARRCRELIEEEIENLEFWGDEESLKKAVQLKALTEGVRGKSIFEAFVSGCIWIAKKVTRKLRAWFHVDDEKSVMGGICRSIAGFAGILRAGIKLVWNTTKFAVSFVVAGVIKVADFVFRTIRTIVSNIKEFAIDKYNKFTNKDIEDDLEDDYFVDEELTAEEEE